MKKIFIYLVLVIVTLSACNKSELQQAAKEETNGMKVLVSFDNLTKDSAGLLTPADRNGVVWLQRGYIRLISVAADANDEPDFSNYIESSCEIESYYGNMVIGMTDRTTADWFAHSPTGKCIFFAAIEKESQRGNYSYQYQIYNQETGQYEYGWKNAAPETVYALKDDQDNTVALMPLVQISSYQRTDLDHYDNLGYIYREVQHIIGACSMDAITPSNVIGNKNTLTLSGIAPANVLLRFNIKRNENLADFNLYTLTIEMESGDGQNYHTLPGYAFMDFRNYKNASNPFTLIGSGDLEALTGDNILNITYPQHLLVDENGVETWSDYRTVYNSTEYYGRAINCSYVHYRKDDDDRYNIPVTDTPSAEWMLVSIIPQSAAVAAGSKLIFKAYDSSNALVGVANKDFPAAGFIGGNQYEFTLTLSPVSSEPFAPEAGEAGEYKQGEQLTEE